VKDVARKVMGDVTIAYIEGVGGTRVAETDIVEVGKNDVCFDFITLPVLPRAITNTLDGRF